VLENIKYNVSLNSNTESEEYSDEETALREETYKKKLSRIAHIRYLNWDEVTLEDETESFNDKRRDISSVQTLTEPSKSDNARQIPEEVREIFQKWLFLKLRETFITLVCGLIVHWGNSSSRHHHRIRTDVFSKECERPH
jgi:hypothetical protein